NAAEIPVSVAPPSPPPRNRHTGAARPRQGASLWLSASPSGVGVSHARKRRLAAAYGKPGALLALPCPGIAQGDATVFGPQGHAGWDVLPPHKAVEEAGNEAVSGAHGVH